MNTVEENFEDDKIQAAIDYLEYKGVLNKIKAQAIEEVTYNVKPMENNLGRHYLRAIDLLDYANKLRGEL